MLIIGPSRSRIGGDDPPLDSVKGRVPSISVDHDGFRSDPEPLRAYRQSSLKSLDELGQPGCLVLLGEPGIGKSTAIAQEVAWLKHAMPSARVFAPRLQTIDTSGALRKIFRKPELRAALNANLPTYLFLDPIDECRLHVDMLGDVLVEELQRLALPTLRLRLVCRTAAWPQSLETDLRSIWKANEGSVETTELVFLRRRDVELALVREEVDNTAFFDQVRAVGAGPVANRPVTLRCSSRTCKAAGCQRTWRNSTRAVRGACSTRHLVNMSIERCVGSVT